MTTTKKEPEAKDEKKPEVKKIKVATQKSFIFPRTATPEQMDEQVNAWLSEQGKKGQPAQIGKVCSNHQTGDILMVYLYPTEVEV